MHILLLIIFIMILLIVHISYKYHSFIQNRNYLLSIGFEKVIMQIDSINDYCEYVRGEDYIYECELFKLSNKELKLRYK